MKKSLGLLLVFVFTFGLSGISSLQPIPVMKSYVHPSCGSVLLTWDAVDGAAGYDIYRMDEGQSLYTRTVQLNTEKLYYRDTKNAVSGKQIRYYISAIGDSSQELAKSPEMVALPDCYDDTLCSLKLKFQVGNFMYWVNEKMEGPMSAAPEQTNGRVFLVIKYITEALNAKLEWLQSEKKATIRTTSGKVVELWIGKNKAKIDGVEIKIDEKNDKVTPYISNGRTMLPFRFVGDNLGATEIKWDDATKMAMISLPKDCPEPDCYNLTVESYSENIVTATNSSGFKFKFDRNLTGTGTVAVGEMVRVCGMFDFKDDGVWINPRAGKKVDLSKIEWVRGYVDSVDREKGQITIKQCDNSLVTYTYKPDSGVGILMKPSAVNLELIGKSAIGWRFIEMEKVCDREEPQTADVTVTNINCEQGFFNCDVIGKLPVESMKIFMPTKEWCSIKKGICIKLAYFVDGLGHWVAASMKEIACPCDFEIITGKTEIKTTTGSAYQMDFKVKNTGDYEGEFEPFLVNTEDFPGTIVVSPERSIIKPDSVGYFKISGNISGDFDGTYEFEIGAKCRDNSQSKKLKVNVTPPVFQISTVSGVTDVPTDENINLNFDVTNYSEGPITITAMVESNDFPGRLTVEPISKEVPEKNTRTFTITGVWNSNAKVGASFNISYSAMCGKVVKSNKTQVTSEAPGPIITLVEGKGDAKGLTLLDGSIDWKHYTKSRVEIDWGDSNKEDVKDIPAIHTYKKKGEFKVKVTAFTKEGVNTIKTCSCYWDGPKPIVHVTDREWQQPKYTIIGNIEWNTLTPGKLKVDWDDGTIETKSGFPVWHNYSGPGIYLVTLTAIAATGEEGSTIWPILLIPVPLKITPGPYTGEASYY